MEKKIILKAKLHHHAALLVILHLDMAQYVRPLSPLEADLRARLKRRAIDLAVLERARKSNVQGSPTLRKGVRTPKNFTAESTQGDGKTTSIESSTTMAG